MITFASTTYTVDLPNPSFGDTINSNVQMSVRRTLSNKQRTIKTSSTERTFNMTIDNITIQQKMELEAVLSESDELTTYTDIDAVDWDGYITNFPFDINEIFTRERTEECIKYLEQLDIGDPPQESGPIERRYSCTIVFRGDPV